MRMWRMGPAYLLGSVTKRGRKYGVTDFTHDTGDAH